VLPETAPAPVAAQPAPAPAEDPRSGIISMLPWLIAGLALLGALAFLASRRRRRAHTEVHDESWQNEPAYAPAAEAHGGAVDESHPVEAHPVEAAPVAAVAAAPAAAAVASSGRPDIELRMRPVRAGVSENDARVEFELTVDNRGSAAAQELRVSTWMLAAGSSEAERALIQPGDDRADTPPVTIDAGETRTMEAAVALPTSQVEGDSVLPVVVADARYLLPDGSEEHRSVSFAVGVPVEGELAHFDMENPSGLHEGVEARPFARDRGD
jgi:LPXTG-motif cell wall-anchored protein